MADPEGRIFAVLAGMPADPTYKESTAAVFKDLKAAGESEAFGVKESIHRRGRFPALPFGISYGNGQTVPARLKAGSHEGLIEALRASRDVQRIANYADGGFGL
jgi:hypothetical protein